MEEVKHKRRKRYSGKYPKKYSEKYKELNPDKYQDIHEHVKAKGNTPAGTHISIMVDEILNFFDIQENQIGLDCTLGYGGHTLHMLEKLNHTGHLYGLDVDIEESSKTLNRIRNKGYNEDDFTLVNTNFRNILEVSQNNGSFDFVLADLGLSSMQIDNPERGFSYKVDGPLDFRMNQSEGLPASELLKTYTKEEIEEILMNNSDEPNASIISKTIDSFIKSGVEVNTTTMLKKIIDKALISYNLDQKELKKTYARVFQALRIEVNHEYEVLNDLLEDLDKVLKPGGKAVILTFHSGEDRLVKKSFKQKYNAGIYDSYSREVIRPSQKECRDNPRATSTKMRWVIKSEL